VSGCKAAACVKNEHFQRFILRGKGEGFLSVKTLYVSDLDGTLLRSDERTSEYTNRVINKLVQGGAAFTYATARSYATAHKVTAGMTAAFPVIVYNGAFVRNNATGEMLLESYFNQAQAEELIRELTDTGIFPIVYAYIRGEEKFSYLPDRVNSAAAAFIRSRQGDSRDRPVDTVSALTEREIFYITCIDEEEKLAQFEEKYREIHRCVYQKEYYSGDWWLEIMPKEASKANAVRRLKKLYGYDYIVAFGDGKNDLDLFEMADEAYAVANADPALKAATTAVIDANDRDGVARWLEERMNEPGHGDDSPAVSKETV